MDDIGPFLFITLRFFIAAIAIIPLAIWEQRRTMAAISQADMTAANAAGAPSMINKKLTGSMVVVGIVFFIGMSMQQVGLLATTVTNAGMLTGLYVIMVPIIAFVFMRQHVPTIVWPCALAATAGIWMLGGGGFDRFNWGDAIVVLGAWFAALHVIIIGQTAMSSARPVFIAMGQFAVGGVIALVLFIIARLLDWSFEPAVSYQTLLNAMPEVLYAAVIAGAAAFTLMAVCQQYTPASDAAILLSSEALFAAICGAIILGERLDWLGYIGCAILFSAIAIISFVSESRQ